MPYFSTNVTKPLPLDIWSTENWFQIQIHSLYCEPLVQRPGKYPKFALPLVNLCLKGHLIT